MALETNGGCWASGQLGNLFLEEQGMFWSQLWSTNKTRNMPSVESGVMHVSRLYLRLYFNFVLHEVKLDRKATSVDCFFFFFCKLDCFLSQPIFPLFVMFSYYAKVMLNKATSPKSLKANLRWQRPARACWDAVALLTQSQQHID